jgi:hypothetical protein
VHLALAKLGLPTRKPPLLHQEKILKLLHEGVEQRKIARLLKVSYRAVYAFARQNGFARPRKPLGEQLPRLLDDIRYHRDSAISLAKKHHVSYKRALALAHKTLACERFLPTTKPKPLSSVFPQRHYARKAAGTHAN